MKEISLHILDIAENSISAGADHISIWIGEDKKSGMLKIRIEDNGKGMNLNEVMQTGDPFFTSRTTRRVGLGIPLFRLQAELTGGSMEIHSERGKGTRVEAEFGIDHPDKQPMGDLEGCWMLLAVSNPAIEWALECETGKGKFSISTTEIRSALEVDVIKGRETTTLLKRMIRNNLDSIGMDLELVENSRLK